jgi:hypothetical protein
MKSARNERFEVAILGKVLTIVRDEQAFSVPAGEISALINVLTQLSGTNTGAQQAAGASSATNTGPASSGKRRGRLWDAVRTQLRSAGRAQGFKSLLRMVKNEQLTDRNPEHALRIALGKKVASGELIVTKSGRYSLAKRALPGRTKPNAQGPARRRQINKMRPGHKRIQPGSLWHHIQEHLRTDENPPTLSEIVTLAVHNEWTHAKNPEHAIKICLSRVRKQLEQDSNGRYSLRLQTDSNPEEKEKETVRRRKRKRRKSFDASQHYPTPRTRQPR